MSYPEKFRNRIREGPVPIPLPILSQKKAYYPCPNPLILLIYTLFIQFFYIYMLSSFLLMLPYHYKQRF